MARNIPSGAHRWTVQYFADRETPMVSTLAQKFLRVLDLLVDMGDRRSAALQLSETFREIQTV